MQKSAKRVTGGVALWLGLIIAAAFGLRSYGLDYSLWYDEVAATKFAEVPFSILWSDWIVRETNPPLYYSLLRLWTESVGGSDSALRTLSVLIGLVSIPLIFMLGRALFDVRTGLVAAALTAFSAQHVQFSEQVRTYALTFTAGVAVMLAAAIVREAMVERQRGARLVLCWAFLVFANALALYAHTTMIIAVVLANGWLVASFLNDRARLLRLLWQLSLAGLCVALLWSWWAHITFLQMSVQRTNVDWIVRPSVLYAIRMTLEAFAPWQIGPVRFVAAAGAVVAMAAAVWRWRARASLPLTIVIGAPLLLFILSFAVPIFLSRTVFWASGAFFVLVGAGLCSPRRPVMRAAAIGTAMLVSIINFAFWWPTRQLEPWREIVTTLASIDPHALVFVEGRGAALALQRYCPETSCDLTIASIRTVDDERWASAFPPRLEVDKAQAEDMLRLKRQAIFVDWLGLQPSKDIGEAAIEQRLISVPGLTDGIKVKLMTAR